jgi:hypothetical protein
MTETPPTYLAAALGAARDRASTPAPSIRLHKLPPLSPLPLLHGILLHIPNRAPHIPHRIQKHTPPSPRPARRPFPIPLKHLLKRMNPRLRHLPTRTALQLIHHLRNIPIRPLNDQMHMIRQHTACKESQTPVRSSLSKSPGNRHRMHTRPRHGLPLERLLHSEPRFPIMRLPSNRSPRLHLGCPSACPIQLPRPHKIRPTPARIVRQPESVRRHDQVITVHHIHSPPRGPEGRG